MTKIYIFIAKEKMWHRSELLTSDEFISPIIPASPQIHFFRARERPQLSFFLS